MSKPIPSKTLNTWKNLSTSHILSSHDLLVWFEICELESNGDYLPANIDHSESLPCTGKFLLHQGVQRRIAVTICHEYSSDTKWKDVKEIIIGRVRSNTDHNTSFNDQNVLTLNLVSTQHFERANDPRTFFRFEASWDSSLHNSALLNRVTPAKDWIYVTLTCYIEIENFVQPACITKDLSLVFYARDARVTLPRSFKSLIYGTNNRASESNRVSGLYRLTVKQAANSGSPGAHRRTGRVLDTSKSYVRGEEMLEGWRPRSDSIIFEHQWELEKLTRLKQVERTKHILLLKNTLEDLKDDHDLGDNDDDAESYIHDDSVFEKAKKIERCESNETYSETQKAVLLKCIRLINNGRYKRTDSEDENQEKKAHIDENVVSRNIPNINVNLKI